MVLLHRYQVFGIFLLMMTTMTGHVMGTAEEPDPDDEDLHPNNSTRDVVDVSLVPGYRILVSTDLADDAVIKLALRPAEQARGKMKNMMFPFMAIGQLITLAFMPFMLMNLKMMAMKALMMNNMALTGAIVLTIRNILFNDRFRKRVIYSNLGYKKGESHRPIYPLSGLHEFSLTRPPHMKYTPSPGVVVDAQPSELVYVDNDHQHSHNPGPVFTRVVDDINLRKTPIVKPFRPSEPLIVKHTEIYDD